ncbi:MAG: 1-acyl-sn-glycerol-3-phosphate acyltransferase [Cyanobacteria bacterium Co-bin8]|nr:1-acyl-sn-glycerol-3-phosphate acyltransferase [Cyanobacteria bacterium Co-bin8]
MESLVSGNPLAISQWLLTLLGIRMSVHFSERIPAGASLVLVSNHRSFLDAPLLMAGLNRPVHFACHHYMSQVPGMREFVNALGCLPLDAPGEQQTFFREATHLLRDQQAIGIFPEGAAPMVQRTDPFEMSEFQRGFAHLAMKAPVEDLVILPVAIASTQEAVPSVMPLKVLSWFDPSEPLFDQSGWHPAVIYRKVDLLVGHPVRVTDRLRSHYHGRQAAKLATEITDSCQNEIANLLRQGAY